MTGGTGYSKIMFANKELNGQKGYPEYIAWWQKALEGVDPDYRKSAARFMSLNALCTDEYEKLQKTGMDKGLAGMKLEYDEVLEKHK